MTKFTSFSNIFLVNVEQVNICLDLKFEQMFITIAKFE